MHNARQTRRERATATTIAPVSAAAAALDASAAGCTHEDGACVTRNYRALIVECLDCGKRIEIDRTQPHVDAYAIVALTFGQQIADEHTLVSELRGGTR